MDKNEEAQENRLLKYTFTVLLPIFCNASLAACLVVMGPKQSTSIYSALASTGQ